MHVLVRYTICSFLMVSVPALAMNQPHVSDSKQMSSVAQHPPGGVVASGQHIATQVGLDILKKGGNAFDAAVAVSAALAVVEPISSGLGGGGFYLLHDAKTGKDVMLDAREYAPKADTAKSYLTADGKLDRNRSINGPWSAGIPGVPAALVEISKHYGRLPFQETLAPAIAIAKNGFPVYKRMADGFQARRSVMEQFPGTRQVYMPGGKPIKEGDIFRQPDLAATLTLLAQGGFDSFYKGPFAQRLIDGVHQAGGQWTAEELAAYRVKYRKPIVFNYHKWKIITAPPPSSGGIALAEMLQILEGWDLSKCSPTERAHLIVEAMRRAYRDRTFFLGDPDFVHIPSQVLTNKMYAIGLRSSINPDKATPSSDLSGDPTQLEDDETTHFSIIDDQGNSVSATQSVNLLFGSGLIPPHTGVLLNDEMDDFALESGVPNSYGVMGYAANAPKPGKRMLSSMTPTIMESPDRLIALGTPGGSRIITMTLLGILGYDDGLTPQQVVALPRYHHQWLPDVIEMEEGAFSPDVIKGLQAMGHTLQVTGNFAVAGKGSSHVWGNMQTVEWNRRSNTLLYGSDPRNPVGSGGVEMDVSQQKVVPKVAHLH